MQKIIFVEKDKLYDVNDYLESGWKVISIVPFAEHVAKGGETYGTAEGNFGAYVVIEKGNM